VTPISDMAAVPSRAQPAMLRAMGRWTLTALVINSIIGSGIFGLPDDIARLVGRAGPFAYLLAALGIGVIMACFAEAASQFNDAGGPYLYARSAFGRFAAIQTGWFAWLARLTSGAANANLFVVYLAEFWPGATDPPARTGVLLTLLGSLALVNVRGVKSGATLNNLCTVAKLLPLSIFIGLGLLLVGPNVAIGSTSAAAGNWLQAVLVLMFAFGGVEVALMPMGEAKNPRGDVPFAVFTALGIVAFVYIGVHLVVMGAFPDAAAFDQPAVRDRPVAEAARVFLGAGGAVLIAGGVLFSTFGNLAGQFVGAPRLTFALAQQRDFPSLFALIHPRFRTPYVAILAHAMIVAAFAVYGSFIWNAVLSAVARLATYGAVCGAVPVLRRRQPATPRFRLPGGSTLPLVGLVFCVILATQMRATHAWIAAGIALVATLNWFWARRLSSDAASVA